MKKILVCAALMAFFVTGESLSCTVCRMGIAGKCLYSTSETCTIFQPNCFWGEMALNISSLMSLPLQGCLSTALCNRTERGTILTAGYTITRTCCTTDNCNGVPSFRLPVIPGL